MGTVWMMLDGCKTSALIYYCDRRRRMSVEEEREREIEREERARKIESFGVSVAVDCKIHDAREESVSRRSCCCCCRSSGVVTGAARNGSMRMREL